MAGKKNMEENARENTPMDDNQQDAVSLADYENKGQENASGADNTPAVDNAPAYEAVIVPQAPPVGVIARPKKKRNWKKIIFVCVILLLAAAVAANYLLGSLNGPAPTYVETKTAAVGNIQQTLDTTGVLTSADKVSVYAPVAAPVLSADLKVGSYVNAGDVLFTFDTTDLVQAQRRASGDLANANLQRQNANEKSADAQSRYDTAKVSVESVRTQRDAARTKVSELTTQLQNLEAQLAALMTPDMTEKLNRLQALQSATTVVVPPSESAPVDESLNTLADEITQLQAEVAPVTALQGQITGLQAQLTQAQADEASLNALFQQLEGQRDTAQAGVQTPTQARQMDTQTITPAVALENANENLANAQNGVVAPISGVVTSLTASTGSMPLQYSEMCVIQSITKVDAVVSLTKFDLEQVKEGQQATITSLGKEYTGTVTKIAGMAVDKTTASGTSTVVSAYVSLSNPDQDITLGLEADVSIKTGQVNDVITIPTSAVNTDVDGTFCFVVKDGFAVRTPITVGLSNTTDVEVTEGLTEGQEVIMSSQSITDGMMVSNNPALKPAETGGGFMMQ